MSGTFLQDFCGSRQSRAAERYMADCGISNGFTQERTSAKEEYTPDFHLQGI